MKIQGHNILITGGAVRIGAAIAERLAAAGARPVIHYHHSRIPAQRLVKRLQREYGVPAVAIGSALRTQRHCQQLVARATAAVGSLNGLINNAAVFHKDPLAAIDPLKLDNEFRTNLIAPIYCTQAFAATADNGNVINLLDRRIAGNETGCVPYLLSKKSLADFTRLAALELAPAFRVNGVAPGAVLPPPGKPASRLKDLAGNVPLDIQVNPSDIADAVLYLLNAPAITGQILFVDGGQHLLGTAP